MSSSGLRGRRKTKHTILKRARSANFKMVWYVLLRPLRPELDGQTSFSWSNLRKHHQNQHNCTPLVQFVECSYVVTDGAVRLASKVRLKKIREKNWKKIGKKLIFKKTKSTFCAKKHNIIWSMPAKNYSKLLK
jgi:hypothetical protein